MRLDRQNLAGLPALRKALLCATVMVCPLFATPAVASYFLPDNYFQGKPVEADENMVVEADSLEFDDETEIVVARGQVRMFFGDYAVTADLVTYDKRADTIDLDGNVRIRQPNGEIYLADHAQFTDDFQKAFIRSLSIDAGSSTFFKADSANIDSTDKTTYQKVTYAPCGICLEDPKVPRGWRIKAAKIVHDHIEQTIYFNHATLEVLGVPIMWVPFLVLPDPERNNSGNLFQTRYSYSEALGIGLETTVSVIANKNYNLTISPKLLSEQGLLFSTQWEQLLDNGTYKVRISAIKQMHPEKYVGKLGDRDFRSFIQTEGSFGIAEDWTLDWDYMRFSDAAFVKDYSLTGKGGRTTNHLTVNHFNRETNFKASVYEDVLLGEVASITQDKQLIAMPAIDYEQYFDLDNDAGRVTIKGNIIAASRRADDATTPGAIEKVHGFAGDKEHARVEVSWKKQWIAPGGVLVTPYLGLRADWAQYDQNSAHPSAPAIPSLMTTTPIAALDVRWPLGAQTENVYHLLEPIFQIVGRSSDTSLVGITNDLSQGLVFDNTNLFSYDRFAGFDRQETGVRANIGARYSMLLDDGAWYEASLGQSFLLSGHNAFTEADPSLVGIGSGLENKYSDIVAGLTAKPFDGLTLRGQINLKNDDLSIRRGAVGANWSKDKYSASFKYALVKAEPGLGTSDDMQAFSAGLGFPVFDVATATLNYSISQAIPSKGVITDQQKIRGTLDFPIAEYVTGSIASEYDIDDQSFVRSSLSVNYDDGYVGMGARYTLTGSTDPTPNDHLVELYVNLKQLFDIRSEFTGADLISK